MVWPASRTSHCQSGAVPLVVDNHFTGDETAAMVTLSTHRGEVMTCPRNFKRDEIIEGLKAGHSLFLDRADAPELEDLLDLEKQGLVTKELIHFDEQSSAMKWRWKDLNR